MSLNHDKQKQPVNEEVQTKMRKLFKRQRSLFSQWPNHQFTKELKVVSEVLEDDPEPLNWVQADLLGGRNPKGIGAQGMTAEQVLRAAIIKQMNDWTYRELAIQCADSEMTRAFIALDYDETYGHSCLQANISKITPETWTMINEVLIRYAVEKKIEDGRTVRMDSTVVESNIHYPTDSRLLYDCLKVIDREFGKIRKVWPDSGIYFTGSLKIAKRLVLNIADAKNADERKPLYRKLIKMAKKLLRRLDESLKKLEDAHPRRKHTLAAIIEQLQKIAALFPQVIYQADQRVLKEKKLRPDEKIVSIFESHSDIIVKGQREVQFGHKVFLTAGKSQLVLNCRIEDGNPADNVLFMDLLKYHKDRYGKAPRQTSADGGFASQDNVDDAKEFGVKDVCFSKRCGLEIEEMVKSKWVFEKLRNFRAGIEGIISVLKRAFGMAKAMWSGRRGFHSYIKSAIVAYNLTVIARTQLA